MLVLKYDNSGSTKQVNLYEILSDITKPVELSHVLHFSFVKNVGLHVIDNLIIIHHLEAAQSYIFDIKLKENGTTQHYPAICTSIKIAEKFVPTYKKNVFTEYTWYVLMPDQIADPKERIFSNLTLILENVWSFFDDKVGFFIKNVVNFIFQTLLLRFIMNRTNCEEFMLKVIQKFILNHELPLKKIAEILTEIYSSEKLVNQELLLVKADSNRFKLIPEIYTPMKVDQTSIVRSIFEPLGENSNMDKKWLANVILEFLSILKKNRSNIENYLPELLITIMSEAHDYLRLQQILQHRVIDDTKFLAFRLVEISKNFPPFFQLAIDMLSRKANHGEIVNLLLEKNQIVDAILCLKDPANIDQQLCNKIIDAAWKIDNRQMKFMIYNYFKNIVKVPFLNTSTIPTTFEKYEKDFTSLFANDELEDAQNRFALARTSSSNLPILPRSSVSETSFDTSWSDNSFWE